MSKQSEAKAAQGYISKLVPPTCSKCKFFALDIGQINYGLADNFYSHEKSLRCTIGNFAVKKTATCNKFEAKA